MQYAELTTRVVQAGLGVVTSPEESPGDDETGTVIRNTEAGVDIEGAPGTDIRPGAAAGDARPRQATTCPGCRGP